MKKKVNKNDEINCVKCSCKPRTLRSDISKAVKLLKVFGDATKRDL